MRLIRRAGDWLDERLQLATPIREIMEHPVPRQTASWAYVFGSAALTVLMLQLVTGILLALLYVPSAGEAWNSLQVLNHEITLGWFIRALHGWGSNFMIAIVLIHMVQVFLFGAYKFPRELTWIIGVLLLLLTLGMAFTGQVLRFDQDAYWGLGIGASISSRIPVLGPWIVNLLLGGPIIAGATLSRFFALHVFVIPGSLIAFVGLHLLLVLKLGINEWPMPGRVVLRATYLKEYHELTRRDGIPFVPGAVVKDMFFSGLILLCIAACAFYFGPFGPSGQPDPTIIQTVPRPDYFFLWLYAVLSLLPPSMETPALLIGPVIVLGVLLALPFLSGEGEKSWKRRPIAVLTILLVAVALGAHSSGRYAPWSPVMDAWSGEPIPAPYMNGRTALERQGALVFQAKQCLQLPRAGRNRRAARTGPGQYRRAAYAGSVHPSGDSGRRQYAGLRQKPESPGDNGTRGVSSRHCIQPDKHRRMMRRKPWNSEVGDNFEMSPELHLGLHSPSLSISVTLALSGLVLVYLRGNVSASAGSSKRAVVVAAGGLPEWRAFTVDRDGFRSRSSGPPISHRPYGAASSPYDGRRPVDFAGRTGNHPTERAPATLGFRHSASLSPMAGPAVVRTHSYSPRILLACIHDHGHRMAHSRRVRRLECSRRGGISLNTCASLWPASCSGGP